MPGIQIDLKDVQKLLPYEKTKEAYQKRTAFFNKLDKNRNGSLTLAECTRGIEAELQIDAVVNLQAIVKRSFHAAKNWSGVDDSHADADIVSRSEFRILLRCLHYYLDLKIQFDKVDTSDDCKISLQEFKDGLEKLAEYGIKVEKDKAETVFKQIDGNDAGMDLFFEEFCTWALKKKSETADQDDASVLKELVEQNGIMNDFEKWDVNRDGTITREELSACFSKLGSKFCAQELDKIMEVADINKDGKINYREFVGWLFAGKSKPAVVSDAFVKAALNERGITNERIVDGLMLAFDHDEDDDIDGAEFDALIKAVDEMLLREEVPDDLPPDCKGFFRLADTQHGPYTTAENPNLKMLLTSAGIMKASTQDLKDTYNGLKAKCSGKGHIHLVDARMVKCQFALLNHDPEKHNKQKHVAYRRSPDEPGGKPVYDKDEKLEMKSQAELESMGSEGYAGLPYTMHKRGGYANGYFAELCGSDETPIYVTYLWYIGEVKNGKPDYKIFVGKGVWRGGQFVAIRSSDGKDFEDKDYEHECSTSSEGDHFFKETSAEEWAKIVDSCQSVYAVGGIPFIPVLHLQPYFVNDGDKTKTVNPYGKSLLDACKAGNLVWVGMSAGGMAFSWTMGPLTTDPDAFMFADEADGDMQGVDFGPDTELGKIWMFPGLGKYVGIPYDLSLKVHVTFSASTCSYGGTAAKAERVAQVISCISKQDKYCALLCDYDWDIGQGDAMEISNAQLTYHVGYSPKVDDVPADMIPKLQESGHEGKTLPRHPKLNTPEGWSFVWNPNDGEVIAAGPKSKKPFRMYPSSAGPCKDAPPTYVP